MKVPKGISLRSGGVGMDLTLGPGGGVPPESTLLLQVAVGNRRDVGIEGERRLVPVERVSAT